MILRRSPETEQDAMPILPLVTGLLLAPAVAVFACLVVQLRRAERQAPARSAAAKWASWSACAFWKAGRAVARAT
jgi:hypothetical protein